MKQPSSRRKWTSAALVGGLLLAAVGSTPAWADRTTEEINDELSQADQDLNATVEAYNALAQDIEDNKEMIEETKASLATSEDELNVLREELSTYISETYVDQGIGDAALILESGSPQAFVERMERLNSANLYNFELMDELKTASADYATELQLLEDLQADLEADEAELEKQADEITARVAGLEEEWKTAAGDEVEQYDLPRMTDDQLTVVQYALDQRGDRYVWGASGPNTWDCSGLIMGAYAQLGINLPHNAAAQYNSTANISRDELQPGDLVFYNDLAHVGMYIGNGLIVHAPNSTTVVKVVDIDHGNRYYGSTTILH